MSAERPWRCFVAVPLTDGLRSTLDAAIAGWRREPPADQLRWTDPANLHLTLAFLGSVEPDAIGDVEDAVRAVAAAHHPTELTTGRLGAFPRSGSARVLWYGVGDPDGACAALAADLARELRLGVDEPFRPHVTLARARRGHVDLRGWIEPASLGAPAGRLDVSSLQLMRSHLGGGPARYETLASVSLDGHPS